MTSIIDLYAGAGGLSLGAYRAGFQVVAAVENDQHAMETHRRNFPNTAHIERDIRFITSLDIEAAAGIPLSDIKGIVGGPPCQGFSSMGHGNINDERNRLFGRFFEFVDEIKPLFFVAENVPGIMREKYNTIRREALGLVRNEYAILDPIFVNAADYGAATSRTRCFFVGLKKDSGINLCADDFTIMKVKKADQTTVKNALEGLPLGLTYCTNQTGLQALDRAYVDRRRRHNQNSFFYSHMTDLIPNGVGNEVFVKQYQKQHVTNGFLMTEHTSEVTNRFLDLDYGERDMISKAYKLDPESFCPTLRAGTGPDKGSFQAVRPIHFVEPRVINPREGARLQGFPDWFELPSTIWHSFRQIGNSVSPIIAEAILRVVFDHIPADCK